MNKRQQAIQLAWFGLLGIAALVLAWALVAYAMVAHAGECNLPERAQSYERLIKNAVIQHWPRKSHKHWCRLAAQCYVESGFNPKAKSPVGAKGLCQLLPGTFAEVAGQNSIRGNAWNPNANLQAGAAYKQRMRNFWTSPRPYECREDLAIASYNAGPGSILKAQREAGGALCWDEIGPVLHKVTGRHSKETLDYVRRVRLIEQCFAIPRRRSSCRW